MDNFALQMLKSIAECPVEDAIRKGIAGEALHTLRSLARLALNPTKENVTEALKLLKETREKSAQWKSNCN